MKDRVLGLNKRTPKADVTLLTSKTSEAITDVSTCWKVDTLTAEEQERQKEARREESGAENTQQE